MLLEKLFGCFQKCRSHMRCLRLRVQRPLLRLNLCSTRATVLVPWFHRAHFKARSCIITGGNRRRGPTAATQSEQQTRCRLDTIVHQYYVAHYKTGSCMITNGNQRRGMQDKQNRCLLSFSLGSSRFEHWTLAQATVLPSSRYSLCMPQNQLEAHAEYLLEEKGTVV